MAKNKKNLIDLFSGAGGFSLGFELAGFTSVLAIDKWEDAIATYNANREMQVGTTRDICDFSNDEIEELDRANGIAGIIGGPPCQGFSMVGMRDAKDERNNLYLQFVRFVRVIRPAFFILENVRGLLTMSLGFFRDDIIARFSSLGYNVNYKILRASDYGVPQSRDRVFFVGLNARIFGNIYFDFSSILKTHCISTFEALSDLPDLDSGQDPSKYTSSPSNEYQSMMRDGSDVIRNNDLTHHTPQTINIIKRVPDGGNIRDLELAFYNVRNYNAAFKRMNSSRPSHTIDCGHRNYFHYSQNRIPTARESARLQSFPDRYFFTGNKSSQYTQIGNAVPPEMSRRIATSLLKYLKGIK